ncbi:helix-turn-helix transcriptional regulator [Citricoccus sp. I39-566]|uniref:helix-turn-helix transcriptional regulator n=1 Tax=Citricoccus sp. I39-566 TaxID=3073268 RepID=UPI0037BF03CA
MPLTKADVLMMVGVSKATLDRWTREGLGPTRYVLPGGSVRYRPEDVAAWQEASRISSKVVR